MSAQKPTLYENLTSKAVQQPAAPQVKRGNMIIKILIFAFTIAACSFFFSFHLSKQINESKEYSSDPNYIWAGQTVEAEYSFPIYKNEEDIRSEENVARSNALKVFINEKDAYSQATEKLDNIMYRIADSNSSIGQSLARMMTDKKAKKAIAESTKEKQSSMNYIKKELLGFLETIYKGGLISTSRENLQKNEIIVKLSDNQEMIFPTLNLTDSVSFIEKAQSWFKLNLQPDQVQTAMEIALQLQVPNLRYSPELTKQAEELAVRSVTQTEGIVRKGEVIVEKGQKVTERIQNKLRSYEKSRFMKNESNFSFGMYLGALGHSALVFSIMIIYLIYIRRKIYNSNVEVATISAMVVLVAAFAWLSMEIPMRLPSEYLILLPALSMLGAIVFDSRTAFYITVTMALVVSGVRGNDYDTATSMMFAGTLAAYTVRDIQNRTQMFKSIFFIFIGFAVPITFFGLERATETMTTFYRLMIALLNSIVSPLFTFGMLFLLERFTSLTTDLRLSEFNELNHPLLIKLSELAPGTYQHTLSLAALAQKCAFAISANELLARVGAYYHDIGKISRAEYFAENQVDFGNKHDMLPPKKSADAIRNHVIEGQNLARTYKLPQRIIDFIPMHHGTTLIKHFYFKAIEEATGKEIREEDFRYPGPKPNSKETAIVMICDTAEALSRVFSENKEELEKAIDKSIKDKLADGQFDECDLTMKDIQVIRETCIKNLAGVSHQRVKYKDSPDTASPQN